MKRFHSKCHLSAVLLSQHRKFLSRTHLCFQNQETVSSSGDKSATATAAELAAQHDRDAAIRAAESASKRNATMLEKAAALRREIHEIWAHPEDSWEEQRALWESQNADGGSTDTSDSIFGKFPTVSPGLSRYEKQSMLARALLDKHSDVFSTTISRDEDVTRALGEAFDRLLLMQVPLLENGANTTHLQTLLNIAGKNGRELPVKLIQHLFSRCSCYPEAIALLYAMRFANINMSVDSYYAMIFSLQRLDEEAWCLRYREEAIANRAKAKESLSSSSHARDSKAKSSSSTPAQQQFPLSTKALDFIVFGSDNQLLPESKPWIGRGIFTAEDEHGAAASRRNTTKDYDSMGAQWLRRLKEGQHTLSRESNQ